ncbi:hypothetical protein DFJ74DRAFT_673882 [Hyaloraphidium curvatum]|nr:hypothetical protein DFJ74DRAFT_673882 [Hyaloraphidium curvatum]
MNDTESNPAAAAETDGGARGAPASSASQDAAGARDTDFTPEEWACLFPGGTQPFRPLLPDEESGDSGREPAEEFRKAHPVTVETMLAEFDDPVLRFFAFLGASRSASFLGWRNAAQMALSYTMALAFLALAWTWNDGRFGTKEMAAGIASLALISLAATCTVVLVAVGMPRVPKVLDFAPPAVLCRWLQLARESDRGLRKPGDPPGGAHRLVGHEEGDRFCPCPACVGSVQRLAAGMTFLDVVPLFLMLFCSRWTAGWTTSVTFGSRLWSTWWGRVLGAVYICGALASFMNSCSRFVGVTNAAYAKLEARLHHRAVALSMRAMLRSVLGGRPVGQGPWLYVRLHRSFASWCKMREMQDQTLLSNAVFVIIFPLTVIAIIVNVVSKPADGGSGISRADAAAVARALGPASQRGSCSASASS